MIRQIVPVFFTLDIPGTLDYYRRVGELRFMKTLAKEVGQA